MSLAVGLSDVGNFAAAHPQGRALATALGLRDVVLSFIASKRDEDDVRQQALLALSKVHGKAGGA